MNYGKMLLDIRKKYRFGIREIARRSTINTGIIFKILRNCNYEPDKNTCKKLDSYIDDPEQEPAKPIDDTFYGKVKAYIHEVHGKSWTQEKGVKTADLMHRFGHTNTMFINSINVWEDGRSMGVLE